MYDGLSDHQYITRCDHILNGKIAMTIPTQVIFRNMKHSKSIEELANQHCQKLTIYFEKIVHCKVIIEIPHKHQQKGNVYQVRIDMAVPGAELVVETKSVNGSEYEDLKVALKDAFDMARRRLEDYARKRRGNTKSRTVKPDLQEEAELREIEREQMEEFSRPGV